MRLLESGVRLWGCVLVCACHADLEEPSEAAACYCKRPWDCAKIRGDCDWMVQFHSDIRSFHLRRRHALWPRDWG